MNPTDKLSNTNIVESFELLYRKICGLRSELLNFKPHDIDSKRGIIIIRQAKGKKIELHL